MNQTSNEDHGHIYFEPDTLVIQVFDSFKPYDSSTLQIEEMKKLRPECKSPRSVPTISFVILPAHVFVFFLVPIKTQPEFKNFLYKYFFDYLNRNLMSTCNPFTMKISLQ